MAKLMIIFKNQNIFFKFFLIFPKIAIRGRVLGVFRVFGVLGVIGVFGVIGSLTFNRCPSRRYSPQEFIFLR